MLHKYFITHEDDELCRKITESLNVLMKKDIMDAYNEKVKQIKPRKKMVEEDM
jgi:hypothetical protein